MLLFVLIVNVALYLIFFILKIAKFSNYVPKILRRVMWRL